jgi:hypothetical protein
MMFGEPDGVKSEPVVKEVTLQNGDRLRLNAGDGCYVLRRYRLAAPEVLAWTPHCMVLTREDLEVVANMAREGLR